VGAINKTMSASHVIVIGDTGKIGRVGIMLEKLMLMGIVVILDPMSDVYVMMQVTNDDKCSELLDIENDSDNGCNGSGSRVGCGCGFTRCHSSDQTSVGVTGMPYNYPVFLVQIFFHAVPKDT
jgi:hypothetical protein